MTEHATADAVDETDEKAPEEPQAPAEGADAPVGTVDEHETPPEPEEAADAVDVPNRDVAISTPAGSLTLRPNQKELDAEQHWALKAIGIDTATDPGVVPHLRAFVHMCQIRALDPFAREAYLIGRGKGDQRKYTMQTGIDGYRKMAKMTGRFIRVKATYWTGSDDDDRSYRMVEVDGDYVMKRVWYDQWPAARGNPGAAKVVIEHEDEDGNVTTTSAVADWGMYAPYNDVWDYNQQQRKRMPVVGADGKVVQELSAMWQKGGPHMLAKCAEALAHRRAFPAAVSGFYVTEEMHRLDQTERERKRNHTAVNRREAYEAAQGTPVEDQPADVVDAELVEDPKPAAEVVTEVVEEVKGDAEEAQRLLLAEFVWQAEVLGQKPAALGKRWVAKHRKNVEEFDAAELLPLVNGLRSMVAAAAANAGLPQAEAYANHAVDGAGPIDLNAIFTGTAEERHVDPEQEHTFEGDDEGYCIECGLAEGVGPHPEVAK